MPEVWATAILIPRRSPAQHRAIPGREGFATLGLNPAPAIDAYIQMEYTIIECIVGIGIHMASPTKASSGERREQILHAARSLLAERGSPADISVQAVAARAGTTKVTIYRYFADKDALFAEAAALGDAAELLGRREQVVDAALRLLPQYGLHGLTMERIAEEAGVSTATLYWHFENKYDLLAAMVERAVGYIDILSLFPPGPIEDADTFVQTLLPPILQLLDERLALLPTVMAEMSSHPELAAVVYIHVGQRVWAQAATFMQAQVDNGVFRPGHPLLRVQALVGMLLMYSLMRRNFGQWVDLPPPDQAAREFTDLFLHGVIATDSGGRIDV